MVVVRVTLKSPPVAREHTMTKRQGRTELIELLERDEDFLQAALQALLQAALEAEMSETIRSSMRSNISAQRRQRSRRNWFRAGILASTWAREPSRRPGPGSPIGSLRKDDPDRRAKRRGSAGPQQRVGPLQHANAASQPRIVGRSNYAHALKLLDIDRRVTEFAQDGRAVFSERRNRIHAWLERIGAGGRQQCRERADG